jgi:hypothetical protein
MDLMSMTEHGKDIKYKYNGLFGENCQIHFLSDLKNT